MTDPGGRPRLGEILVQLGAIDEDTLALALAEQAGLDFVDARESAPDRALLALLPREIARSLLVLPLHALPDGAVVALVGDPAAQAPAQQLAALLGARVVPRVAAPARLLAAIEEAYAGDTVASAPPVVPSFADALLAELSGGAGADHGDDGGWGPDDVGLHGQAPGAAGAGVSADVLADLDRMAAAEPDRDGGTLPTPERAPEPGDPQDAAAETLPSEDGRAPAAPAPPAVEARRPSLRREEAPRDREHPALVVPTEAGAQLALVLARLREDAGPEAFLKLAGSLVARALAWGAEVIEVIAADAGVRVRYRLDGTWQGALMLPRWAGLRLAQAVDGISTSTAMPGGGRRTRLVAKAGERRLPVVSTIHAAGGRERREIRLLDPTAARPLGGLGMPDDVHRRARQWSAGRQGVVLVTGRRDGGRTTTLQAFAEEVGRTRPTVVVEHTPSLRGCALPSARVDELTGGLPEALDILLRGGAPRCVVVDGLDGGEGTTRVLALGQRGVLVIAGVDGADAHEALHRLRRLGVPDQLLGPSVLGIVEQRLVRLLCPACAGREPTDRALAAALGLVPDSMPKAGPAEGGGCPACHHSGVRGRAPLFGRVELPQGVTPMLRDEDLRLLVDRSRARPPAEDALPLFVKGRTSLKEIGRAVGVRSAQHAVPLVSVTADGFGAEGSAGDTVAGPGAVGFEAEEISLDELPTADRAAGPDDRLRLLVVEPRDRVGPLLARTLSAGEYRVLAADRLADALRLVDEEPPSAVVVAAAGVAEATSLLQGLREHAGSAFLPLVVVGVPDEDPMDLLLAGADEVAEATEDDEALQLELRQILLSLR